MNPAMLQPFLTTALPIMFSILVAVLVNNKRLDDINKRLDGMQREIIQRLERIDAKLEGHETRIIRLEERTSLIR